MTGPTGERVTVVLGSERMHHGERGALTATAIICGRDALLLELGRATDAWHKVRKDPHAVVEYARYHAAFAALNQWDQVAAFDAPPAEGDET